MRRLPRPKKIKKLRVPSILGNWMRLSLTTVSALTGRGGLCLLGLVACSTPQSQAELAENGEQAMVSPNPETGMFFSGDPFADPEAEVVATEKGTTTTVPLWKEEPQSQLVELEAAPEPEYNEELLQQAAALGLARLRARYLAETLSADAEVVVPAGVHTFGEVLPVQFRLHNPLGEVVDLLPGERGYLLELDWTVERWLPLGAHDRVQRHRFFRLDSFLNLPPDQEFVEYSELPLVVNGNQGALWTVDVDARLRCNGANFEEQVLPVHEIEFRAARILVLPPGWEKFQEQPLANLKRVVKMASPEVDRHVLVNVALLPPQQRQEGVQVLLDGLRTAPHDRRALTITQALQWLTGLSLGSLPADWLRWEEQRQFTSAQ